MAVGLKFQKPAEVRGVRSGHNEIDYNTLKLPKSSKYTTELECILNDLVALSE